MAPQFPRQLTVQRFYPGHGSCGGDYGFRADEGPLRLRLEANWLRAAGFSEGDVVLISNPQPGQLVVQFAGRRVNK
jgi:hypothetical protein